MRKTIKYILTGLVAILIFTSICLLLGLLVSSNHLLGNLILTVILLISMLMYAWLIGAMIVDAVKDWKTLKELNKK